MRNFLIATILATFSALSAAAQDQSVQTVNGAGAPQAAPAMPAPTMAAPPPQPDMSVRSEVYTPPPPPPAMGTVCHFTHGSLAGKQMTLSAPLPIGSTCKDGSGDSGKVAMR